MKFQGKTLLAHLAELGHDQLAIQWIQTMRTYNLSIDGINDNSQTPLYYAVQNGHDQIVKALVEHGADMNVKYQKTKSMLSIALDQVNLNQKNEFHLIVANLLLHNAHITGLSDHHYIKLLKYITQQKNNQYLIEKMRLSEYFTRNEHMAVEMLNILHQKSPNGSVYAKHLEEATDTTPIRAAIAWENIGLIKKLMRQGCSIADKHSMKKSPLSMAICKKIKLWLRSC